MDDVGRDGARALGVGRDLKYISDHPDELTFVAVNFLPPGIPNIDARHVESLLCKILLDLL